MIDFERVQRFRDESLLRVKGGFLSDIQDYDARFKEVERGMMGTNKFLTEFDLVQKKIVNKVNIFNCLGYQDEEFTLAAINNCKNSDVHIVHEDDIKHKVRYDNLTYSLITKSYEFKALKDYYKLAFRVKHKSGKVLKVERSSYLFRVTNEGQPISQLSTWEVSENPLPFVSLSFYSSNYSIIMRDLYEMNALELKLKFTPKEKEILELKDNQYNNKEIQEALKSNSIRTVEKHIENIIKKVKISFLERGESIPINSIREVLHVSKKFGLYPFY